MDIKDSDLNYVLKTQFGEFSAQKLDSPLEVGKKCDVCGSEIKQDHTTCIVPVGLMNQQGVCQATQLHHVCFMAYVIGLVLDSAQFTTPIL